MSQEKIGAITSSADSSIQVKSLIPLTSGMLAAKLPSIGKDLLSFLTTDAVLLPLDDYKIYATKRYDAFSRLAENRDINEAHVQALMESFQKDGYLFTILFVNEMLQQIDGQHRFEAAKRLHLPIYFAVMPGWGIKEVTILNVNSRDWKMEEFMNSYARGGNENYVRFKEFFDEFGFQITISQLILLGRRTKEVGANDFFRHGKMICTEEMSAKAYVKARRILQFKDFHPRGYKSRSFVEAILVLLRTKGYDQAHMIQQLKKYPVTMLMEARSLRYEEYAKLLTETYNYRKKDKLDPEW
ncbi:ParB N-terminal domain-containing protein [Candidatus Nomurabacteria bacterium]|nr:ParB N-terminal domain-containing protein [Candidatus Nomurabacteria bacterium]